MSVNLPCLRHFLSHCIILLIFFQFGLLVSYKHGSPCDCNATAATSSLPHNNDDAESSAAWWTCQRRSAAINNGSLPPPYTITRVNVDAMRSFLSGRLDEKNEEHSPDISENALIVRLSAQQRNHTHDSHLSSSTSLPNDPMPMDALKGCPTVKVLHHDFVENTCLLVASYEESHHVYRWQLDPKDGVYRPVIRIQNRRDSSAGVPMDSFLWAQLFVTIQNTNAISNDLQQILDLSEQARTTTTVLLLVVNMENINNVLSLLSSVCADEEHHFKVLLWCLDPDTQRVARQLSLPSYYHADWSRTSLGQLPELASLTAKLLAVQQLLLLKCNVLVISVVSDRQEPQWVALPTTTNWRIPTEDIRFLASPSDDPKPISILRSPILAVKSTIRTKALWSKVVLSLDVLSDEGIASLDDIVSEYVSLFGMHVIAAATEEYITMQRGQQPNCP